MILSLSGFFFLGISTTPSWSHNLVVTRGIFNLAGEKLECGRNENLTILTKRVVKSKTIHCKQILVIT
jgi:hypothetical protein